MKPDKVRVLLEVYRAGAAKRWPCSPTGPTRVESCGIWIAQHNFDYQSYVISASYNVIGAQVRFENS